MSKSVRAATGHGSVKSECPQCRRVLKTNFRVDGPVQRAECECGAVSSSCRQLVTGTWGREPGRGERMGWREGYAVRARHQRPAAGLSQRAGAVALGKASTAAGLVGRAGMANV